MGVPALCAKELTALSPRGGRPGGGPRTVGGPKSGAAVDMAGAAEGGNERSCPVIVVTPTALCGLCGVRGFYSVGIFYTPFR